MQKEKISNFTDLKVWQVGHRIVLDIYKITKLFPREELFGLVSQLRRAIISFTSNIAEGFSRATVKEKIHFYTIALGSLIEVKNQILISKDLAYLNELEYLAVLKNLTEADKMIHGLIKSASARPPLY